MMQRLHRHRNDGLTLIEVMVSMLVILFMVVGAVSYMYACAWNARRAEVRITATRIGQVLLETWKLTGSYDALGHWSWHVTDFDPTDPYFNLTLPLPGFSDVDVDLTGDGIVGTELNDFEITLDGVAYFVTLLYDNNLPNMLSARVAWNKNLRAPGLEADYHYVDVTSYAIY
jgi:type II secretory pathway pseudopilin PulG